MNWGRSLGIDPQLSVQDLSPQLGEGASNRFMSLLLPLQEGCRIQRLLKKWVALTDSRLKGKCSHGLLARI